MFGDIARVQLGAAVDVGAVPLHDDGELHCAESGPSSSPESVPKSPPSGPSKSVSGPVVQRRVAGGVAVRRRRRAHQRWRFRRRAGSPRCSRRGIRPRPPRRPRRRRRRRRAVFDFTGLGLRSPFASRRRLADSDSVVQAGDGRLRRRSAAAAVDRVRSSLARPLGRAPRATGPCPACTARRLRARGRGARRNPSGSRATRAASSGFSISMPRRVTSSTRLWITS